MEKDNKISVIEEYYIKVCKLVIIVIMLSIAVGSVGFPLLKLIGCFPEMTWREAIVFFCCIAVPEEIIFTILLRKIMNKETGRLDYKYFRMAKVMFTVAIFVNYIGFSVILPTGEFWYVVYYFIILVSFFLDIKLVTGSIIGMIPCIILVWFIEKMNMPSADIRLQEILMRIVVVFLTMLGLWLLVYFVSTFLLNAKKDELEKNNNRLQKVFNKIENLTEELGAATKTLVTSSQNESASTQELSAISGELLESSNILSENSSKNQEYVSELEKSSHNMVEKMSEIDKVSRELVEISATNENAINNLLGITEKVGTATQNTMEVTQKLLEDSKEIGQTLDIINEIAGAINLLALNASIEAARAGEAGKGFAVVAQEVGNLANSTKESLDCVNNVVGKIQSGTVEVSESMQMNAEQLSEQNKMLMETIESIRSMMKLLKTSMDAIAQADEVQKVQEEAINYTVSFNEVISKGIDEETEKFTNIAQLVQGNTKDIVELANQIDILNGMVQELEDILAEK